MRPILPVLALLAAAPASDWPHYGGGPDQTRYSPLTQITPANVGQLQVAWTYDTGDAFKGSEMQCQPVVAHRVLYATSPKLRVLMTGHPQVSNAAGPRMMQWYGPSSASGAIVGFGRPSRNGSE